MWKSLQGHMAQPPTKHTSTWHNHLQSTHQQTHSDKTRIFFFFFLSPTSRSPLFAPVFHPIIATVFNFFLHLQCKWSAKKAFEWFLSFQTSSIYFSHVHSLKTPFWAKTDLSVGHFWTLSTRVSCQQTFQP